MLLFFHYLILIIHAWRNFVNHSVSSLQWIAYGPDDLKTKNPSSQLRRDNGFMVRDVYRSSPPPSHGYAYCYNKAYEAHSPYKGGCGGNGVHGKFPEELG